MPNLVLCASAALAAAFLPTLAVADPLSLDQALDLAVQRSPSARSARAVAHSATEAARAAGQLPDPMLVVGVDNLPVTGTERFSTTRESMTMKRLGVSQEWVSAGKRTARQAAAQAMVAREAVLEKVAAAETRVQTALAYFDAYYASQALKLIRLNEQHAREELEAAKGRLASRSGNSQEVLALTTGLAMAEDESGEVQQQVSVARIVLQRWVGLSTEELVAAALPTIPGEEAFVAADPEVAARQRDIDVARQEAAVAATNRKPNWTWGISYGQRTGSSDLVSVGVSIPLPVAPAARQDRETASKLALVDKAEAELAEALRAARAEYATLASDAQRLRERIERLRAGVVIPSRQRTAVATAAYGSNQASLATVFEARHAEVAAYRKLLALERDLAKVQAQLVFKPLTTAGVP